MREAVIVSAVRTPLGSFNGTLANMGATKLGGLVIAVREIDCEWGFDDADAGAVALPARYEIRYRTHAIDLTQTG